MADLADLERKQGDMAKLAARMAGERDPTRLLEMTKALQESAAELERMAQGLAAAHTPQGGGGETVVQLTPDQRARVAQATGVSIERVTLRDTPDRVWSREMPRMDPRVIEKMAAHEAAQASVASATRDRIEKLVAQLEALDVPELAETLADLKRGAGKL